MYVYELRKNQTLSFDIGENHDNEILALNVIDGKIVCCTSSFGLEA
jgi:major membrane immunogen (membrane-anchored lipoprotein)